MMGQKYYSFAYILLPDELMATQLIIDSATKLCLEIEADKEGSADLESLYIKAIFDLALLRQEHFVVTESASFYRLSLEQRAVVYLRDQREWSIEEIASTLGLEWDRLYCSLNLGRSKLMDMSIGSDLKASSKLW